MAELRLVASIATYLLLAGVYGYVGLRLFRRGGAGDAQRACRRFGVFWFGLATHNALGATLTTAELLGEASQTLTAVCAYAAAFVIASMFWGLMSYLLYLFTGRAAAMRFMSVTFAAQLLPLVLAVWLLGPIGVHMEGWIPMIDYADPNGSALDPIVSLIFVVPPLLTAGGYVALWRRLPDAASRWRLGLVGGALTLWFASAILATALKTPGDLGAIVARSVAVLASLSVLFAYEPPAWARRRFGAVRLGHEVLAPAADPRAAERRREALAARARELV